MRKKWFWLIGAVVLVGVCLPAGATTVYTFGGIDFTDPTHRAAQAVFTFTGSTLTVVLTNTATAATADPAQILTGVIFDLNPTRVLTPVSAVLASGSTIINGSQPAGGNVGGEWGYAPVSVVFMPELVFTDDQGISSSGIFFGKHNFNGPDLDPPDALDGVNYGIVSSLGITNTNGAMGKPLIKNAVVFTLTTTTETDVIKNVVFQYGTNITDPHFIGGQLGGVPDIIPEPLTLLAVFGGVCGLGGYIRRRRLA